MDTERIEERILRILDENREKIIAFAKEIQMHPERGFEEFRTAALTDEKLRELGYETRTGLARTGVMTRRAGKRINLTVIGEMDGIGSPSHSLADPITHVAHACGHHAQMAAMYGAAICYGDPVIREAFDDLELTFLAVGAEEYIDAGRRKGLRDEGILFASGKSELIRIGALEETDIAMTTHVHMVPVEEEVYLGNPSCNGFSAEQVQVLGKASHGAISPWDGVNALSITNAALNMMGMLRETFREDEHVRLHNVIRKAGDVINSIPEEALVETKVRSASLDGIRKVMDGVNRCYDGAAYAFGGKIRRQILQGYMPVRYRPADPALVRSAKRLGLSYRTVSAADFNNACTDVGDLSHVKPVVNFTFGGFKGSLHGADFEITDEELAYLIPAKMLMLTAWELNRDNQKEAREILEHYEPVFDRESYTAFVERQLAGNME